MTGPCIVCGLTNYPLSMGGPDVCPWCDCGIDPKITRLEDQVQKLALQRLDDLKLISELADALSRYIDEQSENNLIKRARDILK